MKSIIKIKIIDKYTQVKFVITILDMFDYNVSKLRLFNLFIKL